MSSCRLSALKGDCIRPRHSVSSQVWSRQFYGRSYISTKPGKTSQVRWRSPRQGMKVRDLQCICDYADRPHVSEYRWIVSGLSYTRLYLIETSYTGFPCPCLFRTSGAREIVDSFSTARFHLGICSTSTLTGIAWRSGHTHEYLIWCCQVPRYTKVRDQKII